MSALPVRLACWIALCCAAIPGVAAIIEGTVTDSQTGVPLARSRVILMPVAGRGGSQQTVYSDAHGRFVLEVPAGAYALGAERRGYAFTWHGQKRWGGPGSAIVVGQDSRFQANLRISRLGAISGEVHDENGAGLWEIPVTLYRDTKPLQLAGQGITDDRGVFRISGLEPGRYRIRTAHKKLEDNTELLPTFFGDSVSFEGSQPVEVRLDGETTGVVITPQPGRLLRLSGQVTFPGVEAVRLYSELGSTVAVVDSSGRFSFEQLSPGTYDLFAESKVAGQPQVAYQRIWLKADTEDLKLEGGPAPVVQFRCESSAGRKTTASASLTMIRVLPPGEPRAERLLCGGSSTVTAGSWLVNVIAPPDAYLTALSIQNKPFDSAEIMMLPGDRVELTASLGDNPASLTGKVLLKGEQPLAGAAVYLKPLDPSLEHRTSGKTATRANDEGVFVFRGLPPGRYLAAASLEAQGPEDIDWTDPSLKTVELQEGQEASITLTL